MKRAFFAMSALALVALAMAGPASAHGNRATVCSGTLTGATLGNVVVPDGGVCILNASTVNGSVTVKKRAYFEANATSISGSVAGILAQTVFVRSGSTVGRGVTGVLTNQVLVFDSTITKGSVSAIATSPADGQVNVCGTNVQDGSINVLFSGTDILVGDPLTLDCAGNTVNGDVNVSLNKVGVELVVRGNTISDDLTVNGNHGPADKVVDANIGGDRLSCNGNQSPFTATANTGWNSTSGQCAAL